MPTPRAIPIPTACDNIGNFFCRTSWGPDLTVTGAKVYDHSNEAYVTGHTTDNNLSVSGGNDRTSFFLSGAYLYDRGMFEGPNNNYQRSTIRLKATQKLTDRFDVGGNVSFADARGNYVERGNTHERTPARTSAHAAGLEQPAVQGTERADHLPLPASDGVQMPRAIAAGTIRSGR